MIVKYQDFLSSLKQQRISPLYLFYGEEELLIQEALDLVIDAVVEPGARDFNFNVLYCRDSAAPDIVNLAQTLPFMSEKRLVIVKDVDSFKAADLEVIVPYLNDPSPSTCLVLVSNQGRYEKKSVITAVESHGGAIRFYPLLDREIVAWIESRAKSLGVTIQHDASQYLWQTIGNDLQKIKNELEKVKIYLQEKKTVTFDDVKAVVGDFREYTSFDLAAALGQKNGEKALLILSRLLQEGEAPVGLLGSVAWNFRRLLQAKSMEAAGISPDEIMKKQRIIFHQARLFKEQMRRYTMNELKEAFSVMLAADRALKASGLNGRLVLERMIFKLCGT